MLVIAWEEKTVLAKSSSEPPLLVLSGTLVPAGEITEIARSASKVWVRLICTERLAMVPVAPTAAVLEQSPKSGIATGVTPLTENGTCPGPHANVQLAVQLAGDPSQSSPSSRRPLLQPGITHPAVFRVHPPPHAMVPPAKPSLTQVAPPKSKPSHSSVPFWKPSPQNGRAQADVSKAQEASHARVPEPNPWLMQSSKPTLVPSHSSVPSMIPFPQPGGNESSRSKYGGEVPPPNTSSTHTE